MGKEQKQKYMKVYRQIKKNMLNEYQRKYWQEHKEQLNVRRRSFHQNNPLKYRAHMILTAAVRYGKIEKPDTCAFCGIKSKIEGHHRDYKYPLEVIWLCASCHHLLHSQN